MKSHIARSFVTGLVTVAFLGFGASAAWASTITFGAGDYDNGASQTSGFFRDVLNGGRISSGGNLVGGAATGPYSALNFTGSDNNAPFAGATTLYDTNVADGLPTLFTGDLTMSADILIDPFNNAKGAGLLFLFNEGAGMQGLALYLWNAGNSDSYAMNFVQQTGVSRPSNTAGSQPLGSNIPDDTWFRLNLFLTFTGQNFTATGEVFRHLTPGNPNSGLGTQVGTDLVYSGLLSSTLANPYEIGLVGRGDSATEGTSVTNFTVNGSMVGPDAPAAAVPEPGTMVLFGSGLVMLAASIRRRSIRRRSGR